MKYDLRVYSKLCVSIFFGMDLRDLLDLIEFMDLLFLLLFGRFFFGENYGLFVFVVLFFFDRKVVSLGELLDFFFFFISIVCRRFCYISGYKKI